MELQLGLALPPPPLIPIETFDLNSYGNYETREALGSNALSWPLLKLGPADNDINNIHHHNSSSSSSSSSGGGAGCKKRSFDEAPFFDEKRNVPKTLHLLLWTNQPNDEDDDPSNVLHENSSSAIFKSFTFSLSLFLNDGEGLVGWPPVKTWRKKVHHQIPNGVAENNRLPAVENGIGGRASKSTYVKVKMEGVPIARKIDLSVHHSFEGLTNTLMRMFGISDDNRKIFKLTYQDREGDWLLAEDVPWRTFIRSLKCLKLIRSRG
ncbi:hypothetical protein Goshw_011669 [Gossypium schwendimanii]|uniref:Auxin-responsive protein n=1 Tax=Gossypium schwendimanii TaxID=34291 RepID=A0A7J9M2W6_GOSSC|nr:hypothetical protein [Gossypium schwendimanii]